MKFIAYLVFDGRCREAFEFYARTLGGKIVAMVSHGETPSAAHVPAEWQDKIINAHLSSASRADGRRRTAAIWRGEGGLLGLDPARRARARPNVSSTRLPTAARSPCHSRRPSGRRVSAW